VSYENLSGASARGVAHRRAADLAEEVRTMGRDVAQ
jgi:hypothetical protein